MPGDLICLTVVGVYFVALRMHFYNCGSIHDPVPGLLVSLDIVVESGKKGLDITLVLDGQKAIL